MTQPILYLTDYSGVTEGYAPMFNRLMQACEIPANAIQYANLHKVIPDALKRRGQEKEQILNPEAATQVERYINHAIHTVKPALVVTSCAAVLGIINGRIIGADKISKTRGSVYSYGETNCLIVPPVSAINKQVKTFAAQVDDDSIPADAYKIKDGHWFWARDWAKVGRHYNKKTRNFPPFSYSICRTCEDVLYAREWLAQCVAIASDIETTGSREAQGYTISCVGYTGMLPSGATHTFVIPFADKFAPNGTYWQSDDELGFAFSAMRDINANNAIKIYQNGAYDNAYNIAWACPANGYLLDTMHLWHCLYPELDKSLDVIASIMLDDYAYWKQDLKGLKEEKGPTARKRDTDMEKFWRYNALDCHYTMGSTLPLLRLVLGFPKIKTNYGNEFVQMLGGLLMTLRGLKADFPRREELRTKLEKEYLVNLQDFRRLVDDPNFNVNSPPQKSALFYDLLGATPRNAAGKLLRGEAARTGKGKSTGKLALRMISSEHPFFSRVAAKLQGVAEPKTQISNVCDVYVGTHRMRSSISVRTETWRYSSSSSPFWDGTNMQNIRKSMRDWMVADEGCILFDVDYSQSDAVFVAYESNDSTYIETMTSGKDSHALHGEFFFGVPYAEIVQGVKDDNPKITHPIKGIRNITKRIVHGANFQMAGGTLLVTMGRESVVAAAELLKFPGASAWDEKVLANFCQSLLNKFRQRYPRLSQRGWYGEIAAALAEKRQITNAFGMTRTFLGDPKDPGTQREATAFYGQSDTAGNMNRSVEEICFGHIPPTFRDGPNAHAKQQPLQLDNKEFGLMQCLQVHDSLVGQIDTRAPLWRGALPNLLTVMQRPVTINGHRVIVAVEAEIGQRWGKGMKKWKPGDSFNL